MTTLVLKLKLQKKRDFNLQETLALTYTALQHSYSWLHKLYKSVNITNHDWELCFMKCL